MFKSSRKKHKSYEFKNRSSIGNWISAPFRYLLNLAGGDVDQLGDQAPLQKRVWRLLIQIVYFPFFCLWQVIQFIVLSWTTTRSLSAFVFGLLPMLVAGGLFATVIVSNFTEDRVARSRYRKYTVDAESSGDYQVALLGSNRVQRISDKPQWRFIHAFTLMKAGKTENAKLIMRELAPVDRAGHPRAHHYLAMELLKEFDKDRTQTQLLDEAEAHLNFVLEAEPDDGAAYALVGRIRGAQGRTDEAMVIYQQISDRDPLIVPELARYLIDKGATEEASFHMQRGLDTLRREAEINPNRPQLWENMFKILMVNEDYQKAMTELSSAFASVEDPNIRNQLRTLQSNVMVEFARKFDPGVSQDSFRRRLIAISQAIGYYPRNGTALDIFIDMVLYPENEQMEVWLDEESRENVDPAIYHLIHGLRDGVKGKPVTSKKHFNLALDGDARTAIIINDISWMVAIVKERPEDGLKLINVAIDSWPGSKLFQTRGEILMKQGRHAEALEELQYAAEEIDNDPRVFSVLAECHEALGNTEQAETNRRLADEKTVEMKRNLAQSKNPDASK